MEYDYLLEGLSNSESSVYPKLSEEELKRNIENFSKNLEKELRENEILERKSIRCAKRDINF